MHVRAPNKSPEPGAASLPVCQSWSCARAPLPLSAAAAQLSRSAFGFRVSAFLRASAFGLRISMLQPPPLASLPLCAFALTALPGRLSQLAPLTHLRYFI